MPGPVGTETNSSPIDSGTRALIGMPAPGTSRSSPLDAEGQVAEAIRRALPLVPGEARTLLRSMLTPESLSIAVGTLVIWAGSHFVGVGEFVDGRSPPVRAYFDTNLFSVT